MNNTIALQILTRTSDHLVHEDEGKQDKKDEFLCNAIQFAGHALGSDAEVDKVVQHLRDEVEGSLDHRHHLNGYLAHMLGIDYEFLTEAVLQPLRRGILRKLTAKYQALVDQGREEALNAVQDKIDVLTAAQELRKAAPRTKYVCCYIDSVVRRKDSCMAAGKAVQADIAVYLGGCATAYTWLIRTRGVEFITEQEVYEARTKMIDDLLAKYEAEKDCV